ncbi:MAG: hypothetical protein ACRC0X_07835 [Brevinema sp.]
MKIFILLLLLSSCTLTNNKNTNKILTKNIPSTDKFVKEGRPLNRALLRNSVREVKEDTTYNLIERLYDTVWYQTEEEYDDGILETETELVIFNNNSSMLEREIENGIMEPIEDDDYSVLSEIMDVIVAGISDNTRNAVTVKHLSIDETEYKGYWLKDEYNLYIVEGDTAVEAKQNLERVMKNPNLAEVLDTDRFLLSTNI